MGSIPAGFSGFSLLHTRYVLKLHLLHHTCSPASYDVELLYFLSYYLLVSFFFISAVNQLAYNRLTSLCNKLDVDDALVSFIFMLTTITL